MVDFAAEEAMAAAIFEKALSRPERLTDRQTTREGSGLHYRIFKEANSRLCFCHVEVYLALSVHGISQRF